MPLQGSIQFLESFNGGAFLALVRTSYGVSLIAFALSDDGQRILVNLSGLFLLRRLLLSVGGLIHLHKTAMAGL
jgi:hypothetical protein